MKQLARRHLPHGEERCQKKKSKDDSGRVNANPISALNTLLFLREDAEAGLLVGRAAGKSVREERERERRRRQELRI